MIIIRDGKRIVLTPEELYMAHALVQKANESGVPLDCSENGFKGDNCNTVVIPLPNGDKLTAEANSDTSYKEIFVGVTNKDNGFWQDLAIVGAQYTYPADAPAENPVEITEDNFSVKVYTDEYSEDYTHDFPIARYPGDET